MNSTDGEQVTFTASVPTSGGVERWLLAIESMMRLSLCDQTLKTIELYPDDPTIRDSTSLSMEIRSDRKDWLHCGSSGQMILLVDQIMWTRNATRALYKLNVQNDKNALIDFAEYSDAQIKGMVAMVSKSKATQEQCSCNYHCALY